MERTNRSKFRGEEEFQDYDEVMSIRGTEYSFTGTSRERYSPPRKERLGIWPARDKIELVRFPASMPV